MTTITLNLDRVRTARDIHAALAKSLDFGPYYGHNLDALWDVMTTDVERPLKLVLQNAGGARLVLGEEFEKIVATLRNIALRELDLPADARFEIELHEK